MVTVNNVNYPRIEEGRDKDVWDAIEQAKRFHAYLGDRVTSAVVHETDGLVLLTPSRDGMHLRAPNCGYDGYGPDAAAQILELFGFGTFEKIFADLKRTSLRTFSK